MRSFSLLCIAGPVILSACQVNLSDIAASPNAGLATAPAAAPPPAPGPEGEKVYQLLYAGEFGAPAAPSGQRARMLAWMTAVAFTPAQVATMLELASATRAEAARGLHDLEHVGVEEGTALTPVYQELVTLYAAGGPVSEATLAPFAPKLEAARASAYGESDPRAAHYAGVYRTLGKVNTWVQTLDADQQIRLGECRFFLQRRLGPFTDPGDYGKWLGTAWNGADFASLKGSGRPVDEGQMDIGGLWAADEVESSPEGSLRGLRVAVLLLFAFQAEGFIEAAEVRLGTRAPTDYGPAG